MRCWQDDEWNVSRQTFARRSGDTEACSDQPRRDISLSAMSIVRHGRASFPSVRLLPGEPMLGWTPLPATHAGMSGKRGTFQFGRIKPQANLESSHRRVGLILPSDQRRSLSTVPFSGAGIDIFPTPANSVLQAGQDAQIGSKMLAISASRFLPLASVWLTK
jgi:hypothetical protein